MNCRVSKSALSGSIACPSNKSYTHRAIFLASLAGPKSRLSSILLSEDTKATLAACRAMGATLDVKGFEVAVRDGINPPGEVEMDAANSGTTMRIAAAIAGAYPCTGALYGDDSLQKRPMQPLLDAMGMAGARCASVDGHAPLTIRGPMDGGSVSVRGGISSQFVSALMVAAPLTRKGMDITVSGQMVSRPYLDMSLAAMRRFGVGVRTILPYRHYVVQPQQYRPASLSIPVDYSSMALLLSAAVLCGRDLEITGRMDDLPQGDEVFLDILEMLGVPVRAGEDTTSVPADCGVRGGTFDLGNSPDLLPPLAVLALKASAPITITNTGHARLKETDRIAIVASQLSKLGIRIKENPDGMVLYPPESLHGAALDSHDDHRLFMAFCIAGMYVGDCTVSGAQSAAVSYPDFISDMVAAGAEIAFS